MMSTRFLPMSWTSPLTVASTTRPLPPWSAFSMWGSSTATAAFITSADWSTNGSCISPAPNRSPTVFIPASRTSLMIESGVRVCMASARSASRPSRTPSTMRRWRRSSGGRGQAEGDVGDAQDGPDPGQLGLDPPDRLQGGHGVAPQVLLARPEREGEGVEDEVLGGQAVLGDGQVVDAVGDAQLPVDVAGLALLVDQQGDQGGPVPPGHRADGVHAGLAVLQGGGVDDGPAAEAP